MKAALPFAFCLLLIVLAGCQAPASSSTPTVEPTSCGDVKNMHRVGDLYLAGRPTSDDYPLLRELGIKTIFNIRYDKETPDLDSAKLAEAQGMAYIHLPWNGPNELTDEKIDAMRKVLREAERPLFFHCGSANRVGAGWLAYRVLDEGVALDTALAEAKTFGLRTPAYETITLDYIKRKQ